MPNYASFAAAREIEGASYRLLLRITLADPDSLAATNLNMLGDTGPILVLGGIGHGVWDWGGSAGQVIEEAVLDWGQISASADCGQAFPSLGDIQLTLANFKLGGQLDNDQYTFSSGSAAMSPLPTGDDVRLSEVLQHYTMTTLTVTLYVESRQIGGVSADRKEYVLFTGQCNAFDAGPDTIIVDATQKETIIDTTLAGREITDSPDVAASGARAPIVYGTCAVTALERFTYFLPHEAAICGWIIPVVPAVALSQTSGNTNYIFNDCKGPNSGWTNQTAWGGAGKSATSDRMYLFDTSALTPAILQEGSSDYQSEFIDGASTNEELIVRVYKQALARAYVRSIQVAASTGTTNEENAVDGKITTYGVLDLTSSSNYMDMLINSISPMGPVYVEADCVTAWMALATGDGTGAPIIRLGLWRASAGSFYGGSTFGVYDDAEIAAADPSIVDQKDENTTDIAIADYVTDGSGNYLRSPLVDWEWQYFNSSAMEDVYARIKCSTPGSGSASVAVIAAGASVLFRVVRGVQSSKVTTFGPYGSRVV